MQIIATPEILNLLHIDSVKIFNQKQYLLIKLAVISRRDFYAIIPVVENYTDYTELYLLFRDGSTHHYTISFINCVQNNGVQLACFSIYFDINTDFYNRLDGFLSVKDFAQRRKEDRYILNDMLNLKNILSKRGKIRINEKWQECLVADISFSGVRVFTADIHNNILTPRTALQLDFFNPLQTFVLLSTIVRIKNLSNTLGEIALQFTEPIQIQYLERLYHVVT